jgi:putative PIN family toxin of toxin-antitoxin system
VLRAVLDTNVLVSALITPRGASARLLSELRTGAFELVTSPLLLAELREVLRRPKFRSYVDEVEADAYLELITRESTVLEDPLPDEQTPLPADPDDRFLVELARAAPVHALVTGDARLLELRPAVPVLTPVEFLGRIGE